MEQMNRHLNMSLIQLFLLILNQFLFSAMFPLLPWFIEEDVAGFGVLITSTLLMFIGMKMMDLNDNNNYLITKIRQSIPFITSIFSCGIMIMKITDLSTIVALVFNFVMVIITLVFLLRDLSKLNN
ncbi:MAG TPA: hypothetical protein DEU03_23850 [Bacillus sp. (in: Bacteria)]|uniref:Uncharacterized protein n=1 Tax=Bacillus thuringiensis TaxID=1428 RepID=A0A9X5RQ74_BACTU|nr:MULTISPECIES: hypothetical protein [Bacillus cereus group]OFC89139.1 hypothetical protein BTGOE4_56730 [Bacillus thuringiensis]SME74010.1 hypothetical protein BACERE00198_05601 [Bacillus cereus]HCF56098.1 hypothetical protein [Bacillus sp. (in: firmicutes)]